MALPNELLADPQGELVRTRRKLGAHLSADVLAGLDQHASRQAAAIVSGFVGAIDAAIASVRTQGVAPSQGTPEAQMARMKAAVAAADPRRLASVLFDAPQRALLEPYTTLVTQLCAHDIRIAQLHAQLALPREAHAWIPHAVMLPLASVASRLAEHGSRMKSAMEGLRPGIVDFGVGMAASHVAGVVAHAFGAGPVAARSLRRAARSAVRGHLGASRFSTFLETTVASLVEVRAALGDAAPEVQVRARVALLALYGGAISCAAVQLSQSHADIVSVDLERGRLGLRLRSDVGIDLTRFARAAVEQVDLATSSGDWGRATTLAEESLAVFAFHPERCVVRLDGKPAAVVLNDVRARVLWRASRLARRRDPAAAARILLDLVARAPFLWDGIGDVPSAAEVTRELLGLESVLDVGPLREAARSALVVLAQRSGTARDLGMDVPLSLRDDDVALVRLLSQTVQPPRPASGAASASTSVVTTLAIARDLSRRAKVAQVAVGPTALGFRRDARRRLARWAVTGVALAGATYLVTLLVGGADMWPWGKESGGETLAVVAAAPPVAATAEVSNAPASAPSSAAPKPSSNVAHPARSRSPAPTGSSLAKGGTAPVSTTPQGSRTNCLQACVTGCNDDSSCERTCAAKCPR